MDQCIDLSRLTMDQCDRSIVIIDPSTLIDTISGKYQSIDSIDKSMLLPTCSVDLWICGNVSEGASGGSVHGQDPNKYLWENYPKRDLEQGVCLEFSTCHPLFCIFFFPSALRFARPRLRPRFCRPPSARVALRPPPSALRPPDSRLTPNRLVSSFSLTSPLVLLLQHSTPRSNKQRSDRAEGGRWVVGRFVPLDQARRPLVLVYRSAVSASIGTGPPGITSGLGPVLGPGRDACAPGTAGLLLFATARDRATRGGRPRAWPARRAGRRRDCDER